MKQPTKLYNVFLVCSMPLREERQFLGQTRAVSAEKACSNVRYRFRDKRNPYGGPSDWAIELSDSEAAYYGFEAEEVEA